MNVPNFRKIDLVTYKPGRSLLSSKKKVIKLSANESAFGAGERVRNVLKNRNDNISKYPDSKFKKLIETISKKFNLNKEKIICGAGSDEIIQMICTLFLNKDDEVVVPQYSFLMYRIYAKIVGAKVKFSKEVNFKVSVDEILKKVGRNTKIVFIANPNNPTGTYLTKKELLKLRKKLNKKILLVVDDAYFEYMMNKDYSPALNIFKNSSNVFILRTFSKIHGLAALRVGWGYGDKKIIKELYKIKPPFNVNKFAQDCAVEALYDNKHIKNSIKHNTYWCKKIKSELQKYDITTNEVTANFFLLNFKNCKFSSNFISRKLENRGIILREMYAYGIKNCLRLTIGNVKENKFFLKQMSLIFKNV